MFHILFCAYRNMRESIRMVLLWRLRALERGGTSSSLRILRSLNGLWLMPIRLWHRNSQENNSLNVAPWRIWIWRAFLWLHRRRPLLWLLPHRRSHLHLHPSLCLLRMLHQRQQMRVQRLKTFLFSRTKAIFLMISMSEEPWECFSQAFVI